MTRCKPNDRISQLFLRPSGLCRRLGDTCQNPVEVDVGRWEVNDLAQEIAFDRAFAISFTLRVGSWISRRVDRHGTPLHLKIDQGPWRVKRPEIVATQSIARQWPMRSVECLISSVQNGGQEVPCPTVVFSGSANNLSKPTRSEDGGVHDARDGSNMGQFSTIIFRDPGSALSANQQPKSTCGVKRRSFPADDARSNYHRC